MVPLAETTQPSRTHGQLVCTLDRDICFYIRLTCKFLDNVGVNSHYHNSAMAQVFVGPLCVYRVAQNIKVNCGLFDVTFLDLLLVSHIALLCSVYAATFYILASSTL